MVTPNDFVGCASELEFVKDTGTELFLLLSINMFIQSIFIYTCAK